MFNIKQQLPVYETLNMYNVHRFTKALTQKKVKHKIKAWITYTPLFEYIRTLFYGILILSFWTLFRNGQLSQGIKDQK